MAQKPTFKRLSYKLLKLDDKNPRLPRSKQGKEEKDIIDYMLIEASTLELMQAIGENDYFEGEQLLIIEDDKDPGKYIVVEGNRRLTAVKLLNEPELASVQKENVKRVYEEADYFPDEIPCLLFSDKEDILNYLGYRHITGVKSWRLLEKARYLFELRNKNYSDLDFYTACRNLAKMIGSRRDYVARIVAGFEIYKAIEDNAFYGIHGLDDTSFYFNYLADGLNRTNIKTFLNVDLESESPIANLNHKNLKKLTFWFFEKNSEGRTRVKGDSSGLNKLNKVLGHTEALEAFDEKKVSLNNAYELTSGLDEVFVNHIKKSIQSLENADRISHKVKEFYADLYEDLRVIRTLTKKINDVRSEKEEDEF